MKLIALAAGVVATFSLVASAESIEPKKPETQELLERAKKAKEEGQFAEAKELAEQLREIQGKDKKGPGEAKLDGRDKHEKFGHMKAEIEELQRGGKQEEAAKLKRKFEGEQKATHKDGPHEKHQDTTFGDERLGHLMEAIKHLRAAKLNEPAESLEHLAAQMRQDTGMRKHEGEAKHAAKKPDSESGELQELRGQIKQMAGALEELRGEVKKLHGGGEIRKPEK